MIETERNIQRLNDQIVWLDMAAMDAGLAGDADSAGIIAWASAHLVDRLMDALADAARAQNKN